MASISWTLIIWPMKTGVVLVDLTFIALGIEEGTYGTQRKKFSDQAHRSLKVKQINANDLRRKRRNRRRLNLDTLPGRQASREVRYAVNKSALQKCPIKQSSMPLELRLLGLRTHNQISPSDTIPPHDSILVKIKIKKSTQSCRNNLCPKQRQKRKALYRTAKKWGIGNHIKSFQGSGKCTKCFAVTT